MPARPRAHIVRPEQSNASGPAAPEAYGAPTFDSAAVTALAVGGAGATANRPAVASLGVAIAEPGHAAASTNAAIMAALVAFIVFLAVAVSCAYEVSWRARADALRHGGGDSPQGRYDRPGGSPAPAATEAAGLGFSPT